VTLKGHQLIDPFDYLFLNGKNRGIKVAANPAQEIPCQTTVPQRLQEIGLKSLFTSPPKVTVPLFRVPL